jgi:hypothetical protein
LDKLPIVAGDYLDQIRLSLSAAFHTRSATLKQTYWYPYRAVLYDSLAWSIRVPKRKLLRIRTEFYCRRIAYLYVGQLNLTAWFATVKDTVRDVASEPLPPRGTNCYFPEKRAALHFEFGADFTDHALNSFLSLPLNEISKSYLEFWRIRTALIALSDCFFITNNKNIDGVNVSSRGQPTGGVD